MSSREKRGKVWLAVSGLVKSSEGHWLVVKKRYGGLKGQWSLPAGFVEAGETADEAVIREVKEETGIDCVVNGLIGLRTGVIKGEISDNMILFLLEPVGEERVIPQENELYDARFIDPAELMHDKGASILLRYLMNQNESTVNPGIEGINPGDQFGYTAYKIFL
ncbi:NADH pyrophosphatase [Neobacillus rhizosphaerae]|uniref:NADH pyrophosphatase n=1 Tax=Neobacillus rhizosphaerae TaxID=2880965 RepID=A0ABM9EQJ3_9BACI|nr:NUDIX hydrolase [Neobacillus rhizosphaerae]CAH2714382.1 NADH pyrophosphatase [Neobacillus rhizosphaerae]